MINFIKKLSAISPRYGVDEMKAAKIITGEFKDNNISFVEEKYESSVPRITSAKLLIDNIEVPCIGSSFKGGLISKQSDVLSSSHTNEISVVYFSDEPTVTVSKKDLLRISFANEIKGEVRVVEEKYTTENILVGNNTNPETIIFAHYDSIIGPGAVDNAAAVALLIELIKQNVKLLTSHLFVFIGNEEISYDRALTYDGHGFRVFSSAHTDLINLAQQIIVVDGIGVSTPTFSQEGLELVFQLENLTEISQKVFWLQNDQALVLQNYHSLSDTVDKINPIYLEEAKDLLIHKITS